MANCHGHVRASIPRLAATKLEEFIPEVSNWLISWAEQSRTLTHNDFRLDNLLFDDAETVPKVVVIDFQLVGRGDGSGDIAPF
ncbi:MAG: hypothetical protein CM15mP49_38020 [Actinomycetota bacterium]|nr:MAG: hypothetical protein CM15mP49_38020 [Actinomycetota bacterium]